MLGCWSELLSKWTSDRKISSFSASESSMWIGPKYIKNNSFYCTYNITQSIVYFVSIIQSYKIVQ